MKCDRCGQPIPAAEEMDYGGQILCEECYMRALSPNRACDPWAVQSAKSLSQIDAEYSVLSVIQRRILQVLAETGGMEADKLAQRLHLQFSKVENELATLRHMEKIHAKMQAGKKLICLWDD